jgi:hypothetical protein
MHKQFTVLLDRKVIGTTDKATKASAKHWVTNNVMSTHFGQWIMMDGVLTYATTIGRYYKFATCPNDEINKPYDED